MKKALSLTFALAGLVCWNGCQKQESPASAPNPSAEKTSPRLSAEKTSFQEVTAQLDAGGNLYCYLSTEQFLEGLSTKVAGWQGLLSAIPNLKDEDRDNLARVFTTGTNLIKDSGLEDISGFGMSSIALEKGVYHTKTMLHHYKGKGNGFAWSMFGQKSHDLSGLDLLPANTVLATFSDLDVALLWSVVQKEAAKSGFPQAEEMLNKLPENFENITGLKWDQVVASLGGEFGLVLTLDESKMLSLPLPGAEQPCEVPEPALMLVAKVKDDTIFKRIDAALTNSPLPVMRTDKPDRKLRTVQVPLPIPIQLRPTVATANGYLFVATSDALIDEALAVKAGKKPGLKSTDEFRRMTRDVAQQGNNFSFLSQRFGQAFRQLQRQGLEKVAQAAPARKELLQSLLAPTNSAFAYAVGANTDRGWVTTGNGNQHPVKMMALSAVVPVAIGSAMIVPAVAKARAAARKNSDQQ